MYIMGIFSSWIENGKWLTIKFEWECQTIYYYHQLIKTEINMLNKHVCHFTLSNQSLVHYILLFSRVHLFLKLSNVNSLWPEQEQTND